MMMMINQVYSRIQAGPMMSGSMNANTCSNASTSLPASFSPKSVSNPSECVAMNLLCLLRPNTFFCESRGKSG